MIDLEDIRRFSPLDLLINCDAPRVPHGFSLIEVIYDESDKTPHLAIDRMNGSYSIHGLYRVIDGRRKGKECYIDMLISSQQSLFCQAVEKVLGSSPSEEMADKLVEALKENNIIVRLRECGYPDEENGIWYEVEEFAGIEKKSLAVKQ